MTKIAHLTNRSLLRVSGPDARIFLQNLITCDVEILSGNEVTFGALLTPQGKILFDFFVYRESDGFLVDVASDQRADLLKRLTFYRLRAAVDLATEDQLKVYAIWDGKIAGALNDPRHASLGSRLYAEEADETEASVSYDALRIEKGMPSSFNDFALGEIFPHEALMDQFEMKGAGIAFEKGCYVGQEVVSRMQHRGTARNRFVKIASDGVLPDAGTNITVGDRDIGTMGSSRGNNGLALIRLDRAKKAIDADEALMAGETAIRLQIPEFANFGWPE